MLGGYYFMLGVLPLPIPPSSLEIRTPSMNKTVTLINEGEINIPKKQGLREISFEFLLPTFNKYPFSLYQLGDYTAATIILYLKIWKETKYPIPFIVVRMSPKGKFLYFTSIMSLIEDFTFIEDAEELGFDTKCSITLKEYKFYQTRQVQLKEVTNPDGSTTTQASVKNTRSTADRVRPTEIKPKEGESLPTAIDRSGYNGLSTIGGAAASMASALSGELGLFNFDQDELRVIQNEINKEKLLENFPCCEEQESIEVKTQQESEGETGKQPAAVTEKQSTIDIFSDPHGHARATLNDSEYLEYLKQGGGRYDNVFKMYGGNINPNAKSWNAM